MPFHLLPLQETDIPDCVTIYFTSFQNSHSLACWPRAPPVRAWWTKMFHDELHEPGAFWLKAVHRETGAVASYCKWLAPKEGGQEISVELPEWPEDADARLCDETFGAWARMRREVMGVRGHWYLEMVATAPRFQGKGAGSLMVQWGVQKADEQGVEAYVESSPEGLGLYEKFGFREVARLDTWIENERVKGEWYREVFMLRSAKSQSG